MARSYFLLSALGTLLLIGSANVGAQQTRPGAAAAKKPAPNTPVSATGKRSSSTTKATGGNATSGAAATSADTSAGTNNNPDSPNMVNPNGSIGSQEAADGKGQGAYAAPGHPVAPAGASGKNTSSYDGPAKGAARPTKGGSTLKSGSKP